jgi:hypothetical protein
MNTLDNGIFCRSSWHPAIAKKHIVEEEFMAKRLPIILGHQIGTAQNTNRIEWESGLV